MRSRIILAVTAFFVALGLIFVGLVGVTMVGVTIQSASAAECQAQQGSLPAAVPERLNAVFTAAAAEYDIPAYVVALVYYDENGLAYREPPAPYGKGNPWPVSPKGAHGPFQFLLGTWRMFRNSNPAHRPGDINDLTDAAYAAAHFLSTLGVKKDSPFGDPAHPTRGTVVWALGAYNAGAHSGFETWSHNSYIQNAANEYNRLFAHATSTVSTAMVVLCDGQTGGTGNDDAPSFSGNCPPGSPASVVSTASGTRIKVCRVHGMVVSAKIAGIWYKLIQDAKADGINLTGGGFRTGAQQISLRRAHCGSSHYAVYEMPAQSCSPPTARPGTSNHEKALAVDLNAPGGYSGRVYRWMRTHAPRYGIRALVPREPWHWSLGGH